MSALVTPCLPLLAGAPDGIKRLRELILDLALSNKLLDGQGAAWPIVTLHSLISGFDSGWSPACNENPSPSDDVWGVLRTTAVQSMRYVEIENKELPSGLEPRPEAEVRPGDILITRAGPQNRVGISCLVTQTRPRLMISDKIIRFHPKEDKIYGKFLVLCLHGGETQRYLEKSKSGMAASQVNISQAKLKSAPIPLPPIPEQHRIVAKVDELMALCDRLEARQQDAEAAHARLVQALLDSLTQARDAQEFQAGWERLAGEFDSVFHTESSIDSLKQALRKLAFVGGLSLDGKQGWADGRVGDAVDFLNGYAFKSEWFSSNGIRLLRNVNISPGEIHWRETARISEERRNEFSSFELRAGDIVLSLDRPIISTGLKVAEVIQSDLPCLLLQRVARLAPKIGKIHPGFLLHWLRSPFFMDVIDPGRSNGVPHISTKQVASMSISLPGIEEQGLIVCKLDELLALCDQLKAKIAAGRAKQAQLAEALVKQAVAAAG